jgi:hypothetical protein
MLSQAQVILFFSDSQILINLTVTKPKTESLLDIMTNLVGKFTFIVLKLKL